MRYANLAETDLKKFAPILNELLDELRWIIPVDATNFGGQEPPARYKQTGRMAYADGVNWNPAGDGTKGFFRYTGSAWTLVG